jgi:hypothetical protein
LNRLGGWTTDQGSPTHSRTFSSKVSVPQLKADDNEAIGFKGHYFGRTLDRKTLSIIIHFIYLMFYYW